MSVDKPDYALNNLREHLKTEEELRMFAHDAAILSVTAALDDAMEALSVSRAELARRLSRTPGFISEVLSGSRNMTLKTVADIAFALGLQVRNVELVPLGEMRVPHKVMDTYLDQSIQTSAAISARSYSRVALITRSDEHIECAA